MGIYCTHSDIERVATTAECFQEEYFLENEMILLPCGMFIWEDAWYVYTIKGTQVMKQNRH